MKKNTLLIMLSILEILTIIIFCITFKTAFEKAIEEVIGGMIAPWISTKEIIYTNREKIIIKINKLMPYIFLIVSIARFIFTTKKNKIIIVISFLAIIISLLLISANINYIEILGIVIGLVSIILYLYSHKIDFKDTSKICLIHK